MKSWMRVAMGAVLAAGAVWSLLELRDAECWRPARRAWWS